MNSQFVRIHNSFDMLKFLIGIFVVVSFPLSLSPAAAEINEITFFARSIECKQQQTDCVDQHNCSARNYRLTFTYKCDMNGEHGVDRRHHVVRRSFELI